MPVILTIEDDDAFRRTVVKYLSRSGFEVVPANAGHEGILKAFERPPDLILCDLLMPGMDGYEVLTTLRKHERLTAIPVIFLTGQAEPRQVREGMNLGADDYLTKPLDLAELVKAINARLARQELDKIKQEKQIERAMRTFAGVIHDLRDPLFVALGSVDQLRQDPPDDHGPNSSPATLERMHQALERMQTIVSETILLVRSRIQRLPFDPVSFDLRDLCAGLVATHPDAHRLRFDPPSAPAPIVADPARVRQVLENLLGNALKYSADLVRLGLEPAVGGYLLTVTDHGIGIPYADQAGVFEPFFRASNADQKPGHGLGLSIVKASLEQQGGRISFDSQPGRGTTFFVELPSAPPASDRRGSAVPAARPLAHAPAVPPPSRAASSRLAASQSRRRSRSASRFDTVIIDDDPLVRSVLREFLQNTDEVRGVREAGSLAVARILLQQQTPDVVFLDISLPDGSGFDLLRALKPRTAVVFVTSAEAHAVHAFDCDAVDYLLKPVSLERLQLALRRAAKRLLPPAKSAPRADSKLERTFLVKTLAEKRLVKVSDITHIASYGEYSWVYWLNGKGALLRKSLKQWLKELPPAQFVRVHRQAIVNLAFLDRVEKLPGGRLQVYLRDLPEPIPVSLRLAPPFNRKLKSFSPPPSDP